VIEATTRNAVKEVAQNVLDWVTHPVGVCGIFLVKTSQDLYKVTVMRTDTYDPSRIVRLFGYSAEDWNKLRHVMLERGFENPSAFADYLRLRP